MRVKAGDIEKTWDAQYAKKPRLTQRPIPFTRRIAEIAASRFPGGRGLYVGCGDGRNYIPLVRRGLHIDGLDVSGVGLDYIRKRLPQCTLIHKDILEFSSRPYEYVISIQAFQHGNLETAKRYIAKSHELLADGGLLFLRVNSASTQVLYEHKTLEDGGRTILYVRGPKKGLVIHFFTEAEISALTAPYFDPVGPVREKRMRRRPPGRGFWAQFEMILCKKPRHRARSKPPV